MGLPEGLEARLVAVEPCPTIRPGPGCVVLTTVNHLNPDVRELALRDEQGRRQTVRPTGLHKFYSQTRDAWVSAKDLRRGEQLLGLAGPVYVADLAPLLSVDRVYNFTVEGEHCYRVSTLGALVHNNDCGEKLFRGVPKNTERGRLAALGIVKPRGTRLDSTALFRHVKNKPVKSGVTSWTKSRAMAKKFAGSNGIILEVDSAKVSNRIVPRPNVSQYGHELEVLLKGVFEATPTPP